MNLPLQRSLLLRATQVAVLAVLATGSLSRAASVAYNSQADWADALNGASITVFDFEDAPHNTTLNTVVGTETLLSFYSAQGVDFLPYAGTSIYPVIFRNQQGQINTPDRDALLANNNSPQRTSAGSIIQFDFNKTIRSVGAFSNNIDEGTLEAYDADGFLIGSALIGHNGLGQFGGIVTDTPIAHVKLINTFNGDFRWGVYDLQFSAGPLPQAPGVPDGSSTLILLAITLAGTRLLRRRA